MAEFKEAFYSMSTWEQAGLLMIIALVAVFIVAAITAIANDDHG